MRCVRATQFLKSWELSSLLNKMETGLSNVNFVCQKATSSSIISNGGHWGTCDEHFVKDPTNNFKISNCNKLSSTYLLCICGPFLFALCLLIHNNKLKHRKANDRINFRARKQTEFLLTISIWWVNLHKRLKRFGSNKLNRH